MSLWCLATCTEYRTVAHLFGISRASVCGIVIEFCKAVVKVVLKKYISMPKGDNLRQMIEQSWGFPNCGRAIDGSHIPISAPVELHTDFYNRKGWYSIVLQGLVDHKYCFTDIYVGWPGSVHDARVFSNSPLFARGREGTLFPDWHMVIGSTNTTITILGDAAYPLLNWILKP